MRIVVTGIIQTTATPQHRPQECTSSRTGPWLASKQKAPHDLGRAGSPPPSRHRWTWGRNAIPLSIRRGVHRFGRIGPITMGDIPYGRDVRLELDELGFAHLGRFARRPTRPAASPAHPAALTGRRQFRLGALMVRQPLAASNTAWCPVAETNTRVRRGSAALIAASRHRASLAGATVRLQSNGRDRSTANGAETPTNGSSSPTNGEGPHNSAAALAELILETVRCFSSDIYAKSAPPSTFQLWAGPAPARGRPVGALDRHYRHLRDITLSQRSCSGCTSRTPSPNQLCTTRTT
jgi:hypothetical protein